ncbi:MAG: hypothetical protein KDI56_02100 [Xanthomonadales bacterium]|nr:hypothetical protein [Xanthomonadales bacterium]
MASTTFKTILITTNGAERRIFEAVTDAAVTPGELLQWSSDDQLKAHATAGGNALPMFALEDPYNGDTSNPAIDVDYGTNEQARYVFARPGDVVYAFLADGQSVNKGDALESDGAGALQAHTARAVNEGGSSTYTVYTDGIVAYADEDKSASGARARIKARVA